MFVGQILRLRVLPLALEIYGAWLTSFLGFFVFLLVYKLTPRIENKLKGAKIIATTTSHFKNTSLLHRFRKFQKQDLTQQKVLSMWTV